MRVEECLWDVLPGILIHAVWFSFARAILVRLVWCCRCRQKGAYGRPLVSRLFHLRCVFKEGVYPLQTLDQEGPLCECYFPRCQESTCCCAHDVCKCFSSVLEEVLDSFFAILEDMLHEVVSLRRFVLWELVFHRR